MSPVLRAAFDANNACPRDICHNNLLPQVPNSEGECKMVTTKDVNNSNDAGFIIFFCFHRTAGYHTQGYAQCTLHMQCPSLYIL